MDRDKCQHQYEIVDVEKKDDTYKIEYLKCKLCGETKKRVFTRNGVHFANT